jgi:hypothetical protein
MVVRPGLVFFLVISLSQAVLIDNSFFADSIGSACLRPHGGVGGGDILMPGTCK